MSRQQGQDFDSDNDDQRMHKINSVKEYNL